MHDDAGRETGANQDTARTGQEPNATQGAIVARTRSARRDSRWLRYGSSILLVILVAFGAYYFMYISERSQLLDRFHLRLLSTASQNFEERLEGRMGNIRSAAKQACGEELTSKLKLIPLMNEMSPSPIAKAPLSESGTEGVWTLIDARRARPLLEFVIRERCSQNETNCAGATRCWSLDLQEFVEPILPTEVFESVVLARSDGATLFHTGRSHLDLLCLPATDLDGGGSVEVTQVTQFGTEIREVEIAGVAYKVFVQPIGLPIDLYELGPGSADGLGNPITEHWLLAGLVPVSAIRASAMRISTTLVVVVVGLLVLGVLSLPYLRVRFIGRREVVSAPDIITLVVAVVVLCSLLTLAIADGHAYQTWHAQSEHRLASLSRSIRDGLDGELGLIEDELGVLTCKKLQRPGEAAPPKSPPARDGPSTGTVELAATKPGSMESMADLLAKEGTLVAYPFLEMVFWVDAAGNQLEKWSIRQTTTPPVNVEDRPYFMAARDDRLWTTASSDSLRRSGAPAISLFTPGRYVQSVLSKTTGEVRAVLSKRLSENGQCAAMADASVPSEDARKPIVAALETRLLSLIDPVLPPGFGFAVLDDDGTVLFHSDKERNLRENFLDEIDQAPAIRAAILARTNEHLEHVTYRTNSLSLNVAPIGKQPWTLVVFLDKGLVRTLHLEILTVAIVLLFAYLLLLGCVSVWLYHVGCPDAGPGEVRNAWYWPTPSGVLPCLALIAVGLVLLSCWVAAPALGAEFDSRHAAYQAIAAVCLIQWLLRSQRATWGTSSTPQRMGSAGMIGLAVGMLEPLRAASDGWILLKIVLVAILVVLIAVLRPRRLELAFAVVIAAGTYLTAQTGGAPSPAALVISVVFVLVLWLPWHQWRDRSAESLAFAPARWRACHLWCWVSLLAVLTVPPSISIYQEAFDEEADLFAMYEQLVFSQSMGTRAQSLVDRYAETVLYDTTPSADALQPSQTVMRLQEGLLPRFDGKPLGLGVASTADLDRWPRTSAPDVYAARDLPSSHESQRTQESPLWIMAQEHVHSPGIACPPGQSGLSQHLLIGSLRSLLPDYNEVSHRLRGLVGGTDEPLDRKWGKDATGRLTLCWRDYRQAELLGLTRLAVDKTFRQQRPPGSASVSLRVASIVPQFSVGFSLQLLLAVALALGALIVLLRSIARRVFLTDFQLPVVLQADDVLAEDGPRLRLLLRPVEVMTDQLERDPMSWVVASTQLRHVTAEKIVSEAHRSGKQRIVLQHFDDGLEEPMMADRKLELLEALVAVSTWRVVVCSEMDPMHFIRQRLMDSWAGTRPGQLDRWAAVLEDFDKTRGDAGELDARKRRASFEDEICTHLSPDVARCLAAECWPTPILRHLGRRIAQRKDTRMLSREQIVELVLDRVESHYRRTWSTCSTEEKLLLNRLAQEGFVNWQMKETLQRLVRRGLVLMGPGFPLMNESFRLFVLHAERPDVLQNWQRDAGAGIWERLRFPVMASLVVMAAFFFVTQRGSFNQTLAIVGALTTSVPVLFKLLSVTAQRRET